MRRKGLRPSHLDIQRGERHASLFFRQQSYPIAYCDYSVCCPIVGEGYWQNAHLHHLAVAKGDAGIA